MLICPSLNGKRRFWKNLIQNHFFCLILTCDVDKFEMAGFKL